MEDAEIIRIFNRMRISPKAAANRPSPPFAMVECEAPRTRKRVSRVSTPWVRRNRVRADENGGIAEEGFP
jgi:hypothetical protein